MKPIVQITLLSVMLMLASLGRLFGQSQDLAKATIVSISTLTASSDLQFDTKSNHKDPYTSDEQRVRDTYQLNDKDWYSVTFEQVEGQSKCQLALHHDWIKEKGYQLHDTVHMNLLEQGISGPFHITDIKHILPQKVPDEDIADGYAYRPVTGLFTHVSDKVLMVHFESGDSLGITENHPVYSASAGGWKHAFELEKDEVVLSYFGLSKVSKITKLQGLHNVHNLEIKDLHNFLVGNEGLVVHNGCGPEVKKWLESFLPSNITVNLKVPGTKIVLNSPDISKLRNKFPNLPNKVCIDDLGFPDFTPFVRTLTSASGAIIPAVVKIDYLPNSSNSSDFNKARDALNAILGNNALAGSAPYTFDGDGVKYTWHHHQDGESMMLVPQAVNNPPDGVSHVGGKSIVNSGKKGIFPSPSVVTLKLLKNCK
jgi:hypothetical protein